MPRASRAIQRCQRRAHLMGPLRVDQLQRCLELRRSPKWAIVKADLHRQGLREQSMSPLPRI